MNISSFLIGYQAGKNAGGGSSDDVRYVTFMSYDGSVEYGKKAVAVGDDCADPIARGIFETPTRESDVQYNYTFYGWATEVNGAADADALKAVTEDRTVYANFISAVRYYTITYYDGETVLKTESLAYGSMPVYVAEKEGYSFVGWTPELSVVVCNASYTAQWVEAITFAGSSWGKIAEISEAGNAAEYFSVGDERIVPVTIDGTTYSYRAKIVGMKQDHDNGGTFYGLTCMFFTAFTCTFDTGLDPYDMYSTCDIYNKVTEFYECLPQELKDVIKPAFKQYNQAGKINIGSSKEKVWIPSAHEVIPSATSYNSSVPVTGYDTYKLFKDSGVTLTSAQFPIYDSSGGAVSFVWLRDLHKSSVGYAGSLSSGNFYTSEPTATKGCVVGFCI